MNFSWGQYEPGSQLEKYKCNLPRLIWNFVMSLLTSSHSWSALTIPWGQQRIFRMSSFLHCTFTWFPESGLVFIFVMLTNIDFLGKANFKNCRRQWASLNILLVCSNCFTFTVGSRRSRIDFNALAAFTYSWQVNFIFICLFFFFLYFILQHAV